MRHAGMLLAAALFVGACGLAFAQQTIKGKVTAVDKAAGKIAIQIAGTAATTATGATTAPTPFKVNDAHVFDAVKPGDQVTITTENVDGVPTVLSLKKE